MVDSPANSGNTAHHEAAEKRHLMPGATALTIAGSDPSGGAGLQADLKTFQQLGVYGMSVVTLITVQNTRAVERVQLLAPDLIAAQFDAVVGDIAPRAIKTGALGSGEIVELIARRVSTMSCPIVVDPVLISKHGHSLASDDAVDAFKEHLLPQAFLLTPNRFEAELLTGIALETIEAASKAVHRLEQMGAKHVLLKWGQHDGRAQHLLSLSERNVGLETPFLQTDNTHGSGCILSSAITAKLSAGETDIEKAVLFGICRAHEAIHVNTRLGSGIHPAEVRAMTETIIS